VIKQRWRRKNRKIQEFWWALEEAAIRAVLTGDKQYVNNITFGMMKDHLLCKLPSGNCITYPFAKIYTVETDWGTQKKTLSYMAQSPTTGHYAKTFTYGGKLAENITQAVARDLLANALVKLDEADFNLVLHCHDEPVAEEPVERNEFDKFVNIMKDTPLWAKGLPIKVEGWVGTRYKK
jgi:DNA polymerase